MKLLIASVIFIIISTACNAQIQRSTFVVSSSISYKKETTEVVGSNKGFIKTVNLQPKIGYFITKRICVGAYVPYNWRKSSSQNFSSVTFRNKSMGVGPFIRYYQPIVENLYGIVGLGFSWNKRTDQYLLINAGVPSVYEMKSENKSYLTGIGLSYFINKNVAIELLADHEEELSDDDGNGPYVYRNNFVILLGLQIYLSK